MRKKIKRILLIVPLVCIILSVTGCSIFVFAIHGDTGPVKIVKINEAPVKVSGQELEVLSINLAHGRSDGKTRYCAQTR